MNEHVLLPRCRDRPGIVAAMVTRLAEAQQFDGLVHKDRDIERRVLARAVDRHLDERVLIDGDKTVVFRG